VLLAQLHPRESSVSYGNLARMQGLILARKIKVEFQQRIGLTATVDSVTGIAANAPELIPPAGLEPLPQPKNIAVTSGVATGNLIKQVRPTYRMADKTMGLSGIVVLGAVIGKDGHIRDLEVLTGPSKSMCKAAEEAVAQWEYRPYLLNGNPVEVNTTINVVFNLGR
jgi:TonB family protein